MTITCCVYKFGKPFGEPTKYYSEKIFERDRLDLISVGLELRKIDDAQYRLIINAHRNSFNDSRKVEVFYNYRGKSKNPTPDIYIKSDEMNLIDDPIPYKNMRAFDYAYNP